MMLQSDARRLGGGGMNMEDVIRWVREMLAWTAVALAGGALFGLRRRIRGWRSWAQVLAESLIVGLLSAVVLQETELGLGWKAAAVAGFSFGARAVAAILDRFWSTAERDPGKAVGWLARSWGTGRPELPDFEGDAKDEETRS